MCERAGASGPRGGAGEESDDAELAVRLLAGTVGCAPPALLRAQHGLMLDGLLRILRSARGSAPALAAAAAATAVRVVQGAAPLADVRHTIARTQLPRLVVALLEALADGGDATALGAVPALRGILAVSPTALRQHVARCVSLTAPSLDSHDNRAREGAAALLAQLPTAASSADEAWHETINRTLAALDDTLDAALPDDRGPKATGGTPLLPPLGATEGAAGICRRFGALCMVLQSLLTTELPVPVQIPVERILGVAVCVP